jgi:hypothetical protein
MQRVSKQLYNGIPNVTVWRVLRKRLHVKTHKLSIVQQWSEFLATDPEVQVRFPSLAHSLRSGGSGTGSTQRREYN